MKKSCQILANQANTFNMERKILTSQLVLLNSKTSHRFKKWEAEQGATAHSKKRVFMYFCFMVFQFGLIQFGTYCYFSWDIMEPITCAMTLGDVVLSYFFWVWTKRPYEYGSITQYFYLKKLKKLSVKIGYDEYQCKKIEKAKKIIEERLNELK